MILCPGRPALAKDPAVYNSAEAAAQAILDALAKEDHDAILAVLGDQFEDELFTDEVSRERDSYRRVVAAAKEAMQLRADDENTRVMVIGKDAWPMPFPIVHDDNGWRFDTAAGIDELLARHIGENELATISTLRAYVDAQAQYASADRDGDEVLEYAQKMISSRARKTASTGRSRAPTMRQPLWAVHRRAARLREGPQGGRALHGLLLPRSSRAKATTRRADATTTSSTAT